MFLAYLLAKTSTLFNVVCDLLRREGVDNNLNTFAPVTVDDVRKLVTKSKTTSCALDPTPTKLVKERQRGITTTPHSHCQSLATGEFPRGHDHDLGGKPMCHVLGATTV